MRRLIQVSPGSVSAAPWLLAFILGVAPLGPRAVAEDAPDAASTSILSAIEELESEHAAKCHSTASRFQDFLFGTPLSPEARLANAELKKRLCNVRRRASKS